MAEFLYGAARSLDRKPNPEGAELDLASGFVAEILYQREAIRGLDEEFRLEFQYVCFNSGRSTGG